jgi:hypothetical protein
LVLCWYQEYHNFSALVDAFRAHFAILVKKQQLEQQECAERTPVSHEEV